MVEVGSGSKGSHFVVDMCSAEMDSKRIEALLATNENPDWLAVSADDIRHLAEEDQFI